MTIPTFIQLDCPQCHKRRMIREEGHVVSTETAKVELPSGETISHLKDVCLPCARKIITKYYTPTKSDAKKVLDAVNKLQDVGDKSLEELL